MPRRKHRKWNTPDDDPTSGLVNLFDIWMVFAVALLIAFVQTGAINTRSASASRQENLDPTAAKPTQIRLTQEPLTGEGERLGTAYRLRSGQVVYVPDKEGRER